MTSAPAAAAPYAAGRVEFGIEIYEEDDRGKGYGRTRSSCSTSHLIHRLRAERVQASTAIDNVAMRKVLERLGYREEGTMRGFMPNEEGGRRRLRALCADPLGPAPRASRPAAGPAAPARRAWLSSTVSPVFASTTS